MSDPSVLALERPAPALLGYYAVLSLVLGPLFFVMLLPLWFRYRTLRYRFDDEGVSMQWGILFHREVHLTYRRIQDIHLTSNLVERWFGLARIEIQTASGSARAEMTLEGLHAFEAVRDFLYQRMRGTQDLETRTDARTEGRAGDPLADRLLEVADEVRRLREALESRDPVRRPQGAEGP